MLDSSQHLLIVFAHDFSAFVVVIGQHVGRLMDERIRLLDWRPQGLGLLQGTSEQVLEVMQAWRKAPFFASTRASESEI